MHDVSTLYFAFVPNVSLTCYYDTKWEFHGAPRVQPFEKPAQELANPPFRQRPIPCGLRLRHKAAISWELLEPRVENARKVLVRP